MHESCLYNGSCHQTYRCGQPSYEPGFGLWIKVPQRTLQAMDSGPGWLGMCFASFDLCIA